MTNRLETLEDWAAGLLGQLEPASRNKLARSVGQALRRNQQQRIITQQNPDGSKYTPRKRNLRGKQGRMKRKVKMFQKLRTASFLKVHGNGNMISVGFVGRLVKIARVHQYGLTDSIGHSAESVKYKRREILGFTDYDLNLIRDCLLSNLAK